MLILGYENQLFLTCLQTSLLRFIALRFFQPYSDCKKSFFCINELLVYQVNNLAELLSKRLTHRASRGLLEFSDRASSALIIVEEWDRGCDTIICTIGTLNIKKPLSPNNAWTTLLCEKAYDGFQNEK